MLALEPVSQRPRSNSVKRKEPEGPSFSQVAAGLNGARWVSVTDSVPVSETGAVSEDVVTEITTEITKVTSVCDTVADNIDTLEVDPAVLAVFTGILKALRGVTDEQCRIVNAMQKQKQNTVSESNMVSLGAISKRPLAQQPMVLQPTASYIPGLVSIPVSNRVNSQARVPGGQVGAALHGGGAASRPVFKPPETAEQKKVRVFRDAIKNAERSTLIFNLDMGTVPVLNKGTMSKRATLALTAMAAKEEGREGMAPTEETIEIIDDVLSMVNNVEFYGIETRSYKYPNDPQNGKFCTVPVKYEFKDVNIKFKAEKILRKTCGVHCGTPYPLVVRECIRQIVNRVKSRYPDNFVRVIVDTDKMVFRVSRKPPNDAPDPSWQDRQDDIPIPALALDPNIRKVPRDFKLEIPNSPGKTRVPTPAKSSTRRSSSSSGSSTSSEEMDVAQAIALPEV
jgi:hypothetical protein